MRPSSKPWPRWRRTRRDACLHVAVSGVAETVHLTESSDPAHSILSTTPAAFGALLRALKRNNHG
ncbi:DUF397 domain-containing protein [Streptomyces sp. NBC_00647]|uniref:DUF397 domain-containing protein n=1 Tax=Streptomyces sp. NBC_00647 TaxID=2975796 RepID=UPI0032557784